MVGAEKRFEEKIDENFKFDEAITQHIQEV